jgi:uncharacterized coiled-coil DUF342 family protein
MSIEEKYDEFCSSVKRNAQILEEELIALKKELEDMNEKNKCLRARNLELSVIETDTLSNLRSFDKDATRNYISTTQYQCAISETKQLQRLTSSLTTSNDILRRENNIYRAEIDNLNKKLRLTKNCNN